MHISWVIRHLTECWQSAVQHAMGISQWGFRNQRSTKLHSKASVGCRSGGAGSTLLWLDAETRGISARLRLLDAAGAVAAAAAAMVATDAGGGSCATASAQLIDGLQSLLEPRLLQGGPQGDRSLFS
jgi:hypothetical protein